MDIMEYLHLHFTGTETDKLETTLFLKQLLRPTFKLTNNVSSSSSILLMKMSQKEMTRPLRLKEKGNSSTLHLEYCNWLNLVAKWPNILRTLYVIPLILTCKITAKCRSRIKTTNLCWSVLDKWALAYLAISVLAFWI